VAIRLKYIGTGAWLPGIPRADHEVETEAEAKTLEASGLYERQKARRAAADDDEEGEGA
jgi:hypothetical protein